MADSTAAATPKRKRDGKEKVENVVEGKKKKVATSVSDKEKITKKQRTQKKRAPRAVRKMVVHEETDEEPLQRKRKRTKTHKDQPEQKKMTTEAETGNPHSPKNNVINSQAQTPPIS
ncbi:hypothetical protein A2U01_0058039, partial [Trifolium medium]|nr:hypothetical protein [Trifolium medium]